MRMIMLIQHGQRPFFIQDWKAEDAREDKFFESIEAYESFGSYGYEE